MKHLKMLGLFVMAAASLMAFTGSASAATLTAPTGTVYFGNLSATLEGSALLKAGFAEITCNSSTVAGEVTTNNETEAGGPISKVEFSNCGSSTVTTINNNGTLKITKGTHVVSGTGVEVTVSQFGTDCVYGMSTGTTLGTADNTIVVEGGKNVDKVTLTVKTKLTLISSNSFLCANPAEWTANYLVTTPKETFAD